MADQPRSDTVPLAALSSWLRRAALARKSKLVLLALLSAATAMTTALQPLLLAPAIHAGLRARTPERTLPLSALNLNNVGPALAGWLDGDPPAGRVTLLLGCLLLYLAAVVLATALNFGLARLLAGTRADLARELRVALHTRLLSQPLAFFLGRRTGELASRYDAAAALANRAPELWFRGLVAPLVQLGLYGWLLLRTDALLAAAVSALGILHVLVNGLLARRVGRQTRALQQERSSVAAQPHETLQSVRLVKSFGAERFESERFAARLEDVARDARRESAVLDAELAFRELANAGVLVASIGVAFAAVLGGRLTLTGFAVLVFVSRQALAPLARVAKSLSQLGALRRRAERVAEILGQEPALRDGVREADALRDRIALSGVGFEYRAGVSALADVSIEIPRGSVVALVGPSGAGKSTLADLVLRLHDPTRGTISWDGIDVREFRRASYLARFGVAAQDVAILDASVEENIAYGRPLDREDVRRAATLADAAGFVEELPRGYETEIGEGGLRLSGGQRQRIAMARALYAEPDVLILDEATAALDTESEREVQAAIDRALGGTTTLVIAHRLSTVRQAHAIVVLDRGRVDAVGRHEELLVRSETYRRLSADLLDPARAPAASIG